MLLLWKNLSNFVPLPPFENSTTIIDIDASAYFYIPKSDDPPRLLSGMVIALFGEFPDPTTALSYFSKKEDIDKVNNKHYIRNLL